MVSKKRRIFNSLVIVCFFNALLILAIFNNVNDVVNNTYPEIGANLREGEWYAVMPDTAMSSDESDWHGLYKPGRENKLMVYFYGGGVSLYGNMDEHNKEHGFYYPNILLQDLVVNVGIFADVEKNPFKDWSMLAIPYSTGDFHIGDSVYEYKNDEGETVKAYHRGYVNYRALMDKMSPYFGKYDSLVITGSSAGGFAAALLAQDVMGYFPDTENVTVCVDSGLLYYDGWKECARDFWNAPKEIVDRIETENLTLDALKAIRNECGDKVKILFTCSLRDKELQRYQNYIDYGRMFKNRESGEVFEKRVTQMAEDVEALGNSSTYLFEIGIDKIDNSTHHMIWPAFPFEELVGDKSAAQWLMEGVNSKDNNL